MDKLTAMRAFVQVAEAGSFTAAAARLDWSKSAISKHVAWLEDQLGIRLLHRSTRRLSLTAAGTDYLEWAGRILDEVRDAEQAVGVGDARPAGRLRVAMPVSFGAAQVAPLLPALLAACPALEVECDLNDRHIDLIEEGVDVAIRVGALADSSLIARKLAETALVAAASPAYLAARGQPAEPAALGTHECIRYSHGPYRDRWLFAREGERETVRVSGRLRVNNGEAERRAALDGLGICLLPDFIICDDLSAGRLVRVLPDWSPPVLPVHALYPAGRHVAPKVRALIDHLHAAWSPTPPWQAG